MRRLSILLCLAGVAACRDQASGGGAGLRNQISAVGSSTVYPFTTIIAEQFVAADPNSSSPVIEATGTGAGFKLFCGGIGASFPDIASASRRIKPSEYRACAARGADRLLEIQVGIDGLAFAEARNGPGLSLTPEDLYLALAAAPRGKPNTARTWADVNPRLPAVPIQIYGPPSTSGTRDALAELIMVPGCEAADPAAAPLAARDPDAHRALCTRVREDGVYIDQGENDNLIVQKLQSNPRAIGVFGYSYLEENADAVRGLALSGIAPSYAAIASGRYPGARPLYLYVKKAHLAAIPGLRTFLKLYAANWNPGGPLTRRGLIAAPEPIRARAAQVVATETPLDPDDLS